jgi:hypothetical protein
MKTMTYMHALTLHELTPVVMQDVLRYKASFRLRRRLSTRLDMAAQLLEQVSQLNVVQSAKCRVNIVWSSVKFITQWGFSASAMSRV